jgi:hypothetical protein
MHIGRAYVCMSVTILSQVTSYLANSARKYVLWYCGRSGPTESDWWLSRLASIAICRQIVGSEYSATH